ncbi:MAG: ABC transporter ATP-binding protein [Bacteroidota bacterium]|nr:ABC transporter ATP-binding protein [Bacteroidota bacterium]
MKPLRHLRKYFYKYKLQLLLGVLFVAASNLFAVFPAQSVRKAIDLLKDNLLSYQQAPMGALKSEISARVATSVLYLTSLVILFALIRGVFMYLMRQTIIVMSRHIEYDLKNEIFEHYQVLSSSFYRRNSTGDLMARISEDVSRVRMYAGPAIMYSINLVVTIVLVLWVMFTVNARLTWLVIIPLPILSFAIYKVNNLINRKSDAIQSQLSTLTSFVQEAFSGIRVIKSFAAEQLSEKAFNEETVSYQKKQMDLAKVDAVFFPIMFFLTGLSSLITIFVGGMEVIAGRASLGNIAEFILYVNILTWPVTSLGYTSSLIQRASASQARINEFIETHAEISNPSQEDFSFEHAISCENLSYTYPGKSIPAIENLSFRVKKGSTFAILGSTGSGKSTLVQLLLRLFDPTKGDIKIDGKSLKNVNLQQYKEYLGYVPQEVFLFSDTIGNNIAFGLSQYTKNLDEKIKKASDQAALTENIMGFENKFDTLVGERGITLSGGQKQRVAIARAFIKDPKLLILDDCLSAVDTKTESQILENLSDLKTGRTLIIVSHRVSTVKDAGHIIVLDEGKMVEQGNHDELLAQNGTYAGIFAKQLREEAV